MTNAPYQEVIIEYRDKKDKRTIHLNTDEAIELVKWFDEEDTPKKTIYGKSTISIIREGIILICCRELIAFECDFLNN